MGILAGQVALVTGAGRGFGRAIAEMTALARHPPVATHIFTEAQIESDTLATNIADFIDDLPPESSPDPARQRGP